MSNDAPKKAQKKWVLRSTDASIEAGQYSVLAVFETLFVLVLYSWLAYRFEYQWWLYLAAMAAPLILLRSGASVERGLELLEKYYNKNKDDLVIIKKSWVVTIAILVIFAINYYLATTWLIDYQGWSLLWRSAIFGSITVVLAIAFRGVFTGKGASTADALAVVVIKGDKYKLLNIIIFIIFSPFIIPTFLGISLGVWLYSLWIRTIATLEHPILGLRQLPVNLRGILWQLDLTQPPELLPKAKHVDDFFSVNGLLSEGKVDNLIVRISYLLMAISWYIPAILWRVVVSTCDFPKSKN